MCSVCVCYKETNRTEQNGQGQKGVRKSQGGCVSVCECVCVCVCVWVACSSKEERVYVRVSRVETVCVCVRGVCV